MSWCAILSFKLSYPVLRLLVSACPQEELHNRRMTLERGVYKRCAAILYIYIKRGAPHSTREGEGDRMQGEKRKKT